jgi:hypothetical protein
VNRLIAKVLFLHPRHFIFCADPCPCRVRAESVLKEKTHSRVRDLPYLRLAFLLGRICCNAGTLAITISMEIASNDPELKFF